MSGSGSSATPSIGTHTDPGSAGLVRVGLLRPDVVVWAGFILALVTVVLYVAIYGSYYPHEDDWETVHFVTGHWPVSWDWLWSPHNEHRMFLPRVVWWGLASAFGPDPRVILWADVALLSAATALFLRLAKRLRGRAGYGDLVIPLVLLSVSQYRNLLWATQLMWFLPVLLFAVAAHAVVGRGGVRGCVLVAVMASLMILCGGPGLLLAAPLIGWVMLRAVGVIRGWWGENGAGVPRRWGGAVAFGSGAAAVAVGGLYLHGLNRRVETESLRPDLVLEGCVEFLAVGVSPGDVGRVLGVGGAVAAAYVAIACVVLVLVVRGLRGPRRNGIALGLLTLLGAVGAMTLVISYGRGPRLAGSCALPRYVLASSLAPVVLQLVLASWGARRVAGGVSLLLLALILWRMPANIETAVDWGEKTKKSFDALDRDVREGVPAMTLARRHYRVLFDLPDQVRRVYFFLALMNHGKWRPFVDGVSLNLANEALTEIPVSLQDVRVAGTSWDGRRGVSTGTDPHLTIRLERPVRAVGVRFSIAVQTEKNRRSMIQVMATRSDGGLPTRWAQSVNFWRVRSEVPLPVEIALDGSEIDYLRFDPDNRRCGFELTGVKLLVAADEAADRNR